MSLFTPETKIPADRNSVANDMAQKDWRQVTDIFNAALRRMPEERPVFLEQICGGDKILRGEVESLLASYDDAESFLESPAVGEVADFIGQIKNLENGKGFGHYEIIEQIGAGGMGEVYLAKDKKLNRQVAVKILNEKFSRDESNLNRFIQEARAASALNHPNILVIHEIGAEGDAHFIVSEFIKGETLREIFKKRTLKLSEVLDVSIQIANALCTAHEARLVHRDIKPENIMLRPDGYVKILDFGLAKIIEQKSVGFEDATPLQNQTAKGLIMGTVNYMSPEQARGEKVDATTDIFSFGVVIYEMIAGRTPFAGDSLSETFANLINAEPHSLPYFAVSVPDELLRIITKTLRKNKDERYQMMNELLAELKSLRESLTLDKGIGKSHSSTAENATTILQATTGDINRKTAETNYGFVRQLNQYRSITPILLTMLIIVSAGIFYIRSNFIEELPMNFQAQKSTRLTAVGKAVNAVISPDGKYVVYVVEDDGQQSLWLRHIASESTVQLLPSGINNIFGLQFSPDSNHVYYNSNRSVYQIPVLGGTPAKVLDDIKGGLTFSPDAKHIAFRRIQGQYFKINSIIIADTDGTNQRQLISREDIFDSPIAWLPNGKIIACVRVNPEKYYTKEILAVQVADGSAALIPSPVLLNIIGQIVWMPDGKSLLIVAAALDGDEAGLSQILQVQYPGGETQSITKDSSDYTNVSLTADGHSLVSVKLEHTAHIWTMPADDINGLKQLTFGSDKNDGAQGISYLSDAKIVYDSTPNRKSEAWIVGANGNDSRQLMTDAGSTTVSPDGRFLVYQNTIKEKVGLWRMDLSNGNKKQLTQKADLLPTFSPDGKWITYQGFTDQTPPASLYKVSIDGGETIQLTKNIIPFSPTVSPDGKQIAFSFGSREGDKYKQYIALMPFGGGEITKMFDANLQYMDNYGKQNLQWTPDGKAVNYIALDKNVSNIWQKPIDGSASLQITNFTNDHIFNFAFSPDGSRLALSRGTFSSDVVLIENAK